MRSHGPSRWLGPLALLVAVAAVFAVVSASTGDGGGDGPAKTVTAEDGGRRTSTGKETTTGPRTTRTKRRTYTVRPGDTFASIAETTGVTVEELQELNPRVDPNSLTVGQKIKLTE
jgi:LysM repeat protein